MRATAGTGRERRAAMSAFVLMLVLFLVVPFCAGLVGGAVILWLGRPDA